jgi:hypothetical protein
MTDMMYPPLAGAERRLQAMGFGAVAMGRRVFLVGGSARAHAAHCHLHENIWKASGAARSAIGGVRLLIAM